MFGWFFPLMVAGTSHPQTQSNAQNATRPNIILVFSDDHARQAISAYGSKLIKTPSIDRLASQGTLFTRHYTSNPICAPSRATLLTGLYSHANGHKDNKSKFDGTQPNIAKMLQSAGYQTAWIGKWHLESNPTGFNHWEILPGQGAYYQPKFITPKGNISTTGYVTDIITQKSLTWLKEAASQPSPFFLVIGHKAPHRPWMPGPNSLPLFRNQTFPEPRNLRTDYATLSTAAKAAHMGIGSNLRTKDDLMVNNTPPVLTAPQKSVWESIFKPEDDAYNAEITKTGDIIGANYQRYLRNYLRCISDVDRSLGEVMNFVEGSSISKNTIIIYASDQGFFLGEKGWFDKRWFYEESAGTPLIVKLPPIQRAQNQFIQAKSLKVSALTSNVDIAPTILEAAHVQVPTTMQGESLLPLIISPKDKSVLNKHTEAFGHFYESYDGEHKVAKYVALATQRYKIIFYYELNEWELFDLQKDPTESLNLAQSNKHAKLLVEMKSKLAHKMESIQEDPTVIQQVKAGLQQTHQKQPNASTSLTWRY